MDPRSFDTLARTLARPQSRRGLLGAALALSTGALARNFAGAQSVCPPGQSPNRKGDCSCPPGTDACLDGCFNLRSNIANCGECGQGCVGGTCKKGECQCSVGSILCDGVCLSQQDLREDELNCGACGVVCPDGQVCSDGTCQCPSGLEFCTDVCIDTSTDANNCGGCGVTCDDGNRCTDDTCNGGVCRNEAVQGRPCTMDGGVCTTLGDCQCPFGFTLCDDGPSDICCPSETGCNPDGTCVCIASGAICTTGIDTCAFCCSGSFTCTGGEFGCTCD